jgi:hypothetical protein
MIMSERIAGFRLAAAVCLFAASAGAQNGTSPPATAQTSSSSANRSKGKPSRHRRFVFTACGILSAVLASGALAGAVSAKPPLSINAEVVDSLGRPLPEARIILRNAADVPINECVTDWAGRCSIRVSVAGGYTLTTDKSGFRGSVVTILQSSGRTERVTTIVLESEKPLTMLVRAARLKAQNDLSRTGVSKYTMTDHDISNLPTGKYTPLNQVMLQMPGVTLDQNQEIHIRGEHMGIQYQMNGILLPLDINTDPTFTQLLNSFFVKSVSLLDGILPARYGYRTAGVIDIVTKSGCSQQGGDFSLLGGQRSTVEPSFELAARGVSGRR